MESVYSLVSVIEHSEKTFLKNLLGEIIGFLTRKIFFPLFLLKPSPSSPIQHFHSFAIITFIFAEPSLFLSGKVTYWDH